MPNNNNKKLDPLQETTQKLILGAVGEGIYGLDCEGRTTFANTAATNILGWNEADIIGKPLHDIHHHSHADGSPYAKEDCPIYAALKDGEVHKVCDEVFWHADGHCVSVEYVSTPIWDEGKLKGAVVIFRDVSEQRVSESEREAAFEQIKCLKEQLELERDYLMYEINTTSDFGEMVGTSQSLKRTLNQIDAVAATPASVLVLGESGVGKELIARAIHAHSDRKDKPLVKVNCASIPKELFESEFFGHVKGAFTGAHRDRVGRMQLANGGTLFLDEVGEIPMDQQGKLLRALQENTFERVGDENTISVDVRIVAATNRDLMKEVKQGRFREDLYYRLSVFPVEVPPLRERQEDIIPLAQHFIALSCQQMQRNNLILSQRHAQQLQNHNWPGNIRELKNVIERAVILSSGSKLRLDLAMPEVDISNAHVPLLPDKDAGLLNESDLRILERANIVKSLRQTNWKISGKDGAAELFGIKPSTLAYRIGVFEITKKKDGVKA